MRALRCLSSDWLKRFVNIDNQPAGILAFILKELAMRKFIVLLALATSASLTLVRANLAQTLTKSSAETSANDNWRAEALERLKGIYDRGVFRTPTLSGDWVDDSSGYHVNETDPDTKKPVTALYDAVSGARQVVAAVENNPRVSPDGKFTLVDKGGNLVLKYGSDAEPEKLEPEKLIENPAEQDIRYHKFQWHPSRKYAAFIETDRSEIRLRSVLVPGDPSFPGVAQHRFARVGEKIPGVRVGIFNAEDSSVTWVSLDIPEDGHYIRFLTWIPNSDKLMVEQLSRFRDKRDFLVASTDGKVERIYREVNDAWAVGPHGINSGAHWIDDGQAFIFISEKGGWRQAYLCSRDGKQETKLTGEYDIIDRVTIDQAGGWYYFYASPENGTQKYLYRVPLDGSAKEERITPADQPGTHDYIVSPNGKQALHSYSTLNDPPVVDLVDLMGHKCVRLIQDNAAVRQKFKELVSNPTEFVSIDIGGGVEMDACITKPNDFDESKKYPVLVYVYGEPYLQTVLDRWSAGQTDFHRVVANAGYIVVSIDNRGTHCPKGAAWRRSIFGSLGPLSTEEQAAGIQKLAEMKPYIDLSRVAIWGWSGGGSNTLNALFRKPDVYHVGIAVVPKPQPWLYNAGFQEIYMRTREVNEQGYQKSAPINFAEGLEGKLLIITGSGETNTHIQIIEGLIDKLVELGKPFDYMVYPNRNHGLREGKGTVVHVRMKILRYLIENPPAGPQ